MAPLPVPHGSIEPWSLAPSCVSDWPGASTIRDEGYPTLKPPELAGPVTPLPPQRPVKRPPALNLADAKAMLQETLEKATSQPESPGTPHWGSSPASECQPYRWCATPVTDVDDDMGDVASDNDNSSVMSFDGGSAVGSPALKEVVEAFSKPHRDDADRHFKVRWDDMAPVKKKLAEVEGAESARSSAPIPSPLPETERGSVVNQTTHDTTLQHSVDAARIESIRSALKRVAKSLGPEAAEDLLRLRKESPPQCELQIQALEGLEPNSNSEMVSLTHCSIPEEFFQETCDSVPTEVPSSSDADSLPTEMPSSSDADSILTYSPSDSPKSAPDSRGWEVQIADSDHSSSGAIARAVARVAQSRLGSTVTDNVSRVAVATPSAILSSKDSGEYGLPPGSQHKMLERRSCGVPLLAANCTALPEHACGGPSSGQTASHPQTCLPALAATGPRTPTPAVGRHLHRMVNSVRPSSELRLSELARIRSRPASPHPSKTDGPSLPNAGGSMVSCSSQQRCTQILSRLDQVLEQVDNASASWLRAPPEQRKQRETSDSSSAPEKSSAAHSLKCPRGHTLVPTGFRRDWICDGCEQRFEEELADGGCCHRCALCDFDLCALCAKAAASSNIPVGLQASPQCPRHLHDQIALPLMKCTRELGRAYSCLEEVNWLHICAHGVVMPAAVYNQACCLALGAEALLQGVGEIIQPPLPPYSNDRASSRDVVEHQLNLAVEMLNRAIQAGYLDASNMLTDPDLKLLRERRSTEFKSALQRLNLQANSDTLVWQSIPA